MTTHSVSTAAELVAANAAAGTGDTILLAEGVYELTSTLTISDQGLRIYCSGEHGSAVIRSDADPIFNVNAADDVQIDGLKFIGFESLTYRGIYSDNASGGIVANCTFRNLAICGKLDSTADEWLFDSNDFEPFGVDELVGEANSGYALIFGRGAHIVRNNKFTASPGRGRHAVYMTTGASNCVIEHNRMSGFNHATIAMNSSAEHNTNDGNIIRYNRISGGAVGSTNAGAIEISGKCANTEITGNQIHYVGSVGIMINTIGLVTTPANTIQKNRINGVGLHGIALLGASGNTIDRNNISQVSRTTEGGSSCIYLQAWYQSEPTKASSNNTISNNRLRTDGADEAIEYNPTEPVGTGNTESNNEVIA